MAKFKVKLTKQQKWEEANREFVDAVVGLSALDLNARLSTLSKNMEEVRESLEEAMEPGNPLKEAKDAYAELKGPFTDASKLLKAKTKYVYRLLKEKGGK
jgi:hypothetical protein